MARNRGYLDVWAPIGFSAEDIKHARRFGGLDFVHCRIGDHCDRPAVQLIEDRPIYDVRGTIIVQNPHGAKTSLGNQQRSVTLAVKRPPT